MRDTGDMMEDALSEVSRDLLPSAYLAITRVTRLHDLNIIFAAARTAIALSAVHAQVSMYCNECTEREEK